MYQTQTIWNERMYQSSYETLPNNLPTEKFCGTFCIRHTNVTEVYTIASSLKNDCSSGHDDIPVRYMG